MDIKNPITYFLPIIQRKFRLESLESYHLYIKEGDDWQPIPLNSSFYDLDVALGAEVVFSAKDKPIQELYVEEKKQDKPSISENLVFNTKKKWVVLNGNVLNVYKTQQDEESNAPAETYSLPEYVISVDKKNKLSVDLISTKSRRDVHQLKFNTEEEANLWLDQLRLSCQDSDESIDNVVQNTYFGAPLEKALTDGRQVPYIVEHCIKYIEEKAMEVEGIFRLSGSQVQIDRYRDEFNSGVMVDLSNEIDAHTVSGLLKLYFREMPEPLLTYSLYDSFIAAQNEKDSAKRVRYVRHLIKSLPEGNRETLKYLMAFLRRVEKYSDVNKMAIHNLATVFAPNLLKPQEGNMLQVVQDTPLVNGIVVTFIEEFDAIFSEEEPSEVAPVMAKTLYDYAAQTSNELTIKKDDIVRVHQQGAKGWWYGELNGKFGLFPGSYVQLMPQGLNKKQKFLKEMEAVKNNIDEENSLIQELEQTKEQILKEMNMLNQKKEEAKSEAKALRSEILTLLRSFQDSDDSFEKKFQTFSAYFDALSKTTTAMSASKVSLFESLSTLKKTLSTEPKYKKLKDRLLPQIETIHSQSEEESKVVANVNERKVQVLQQLTELSNLLNTE